MKRHGRRDIEREEDRHYHTQSTLLKVTGTELRPNYSEMGRVVLKLCSATYLAIISFSLLEECPPLPKTLAGVERK